MANPVISYPGAKWRFWPYIKQYIPHDIKDYREPFFGGGSMGLSIADDPDFNLERIVVGDLAPEIWALWQGIKENAPEVKEQAINWFKASCPAQLDLQFLSENDDEYPEVYERAIDQGRKFWEWAATVDCTLLNLVQRSARTYLVNKISFSGMGDSGSLSKERYTGFRLEATERITAAQPLLQKMEIKNCTFEETMADVDPVKSFVFLDPPYYRQESSGLYGRGGDTHHGFPHEHFAEFTLQTNCRWFVTYDDSPKVRRMFAKRPSFGGLRESQMTPFVIPGGYTMAQKNSEDALAGEELFISNYDINDTDFDDKGLI